MRNNKFRVPPASKASPGVFVALSLCLGGLVWAAPPDLTNGGLPTSTINLNLGPTGMHGWLYHVNTDSSESRQVLVTSVDVGSPADGILAVDDVILGADGTGANPVNFSSDARRALAQAIADAEANSPAVLKLLRWRAGITTTESITLQSLGAYSATAPYNCPKSAQILENGLAHRAANEGPGKFGFGTLALLAGNDPSNPANAARQTLAQSEAHALIATQEQIDFWKSGQIDTGSKITWSLGHQLTVLAEYYLQTSDPMVLPTIEAMAVQVANGQSHLGTMGHQLTNPDAQVGLNGAYNVGYGTVNSAGMPTFLGLLLARECGLTNPEIDPAIERASRYYAAYSGYGAHPYGEHGPYSKAHESNGKSGLSSLCFMLLGDRAEEGKFYSMMATAAASEREDGHTGPYFNQLWAPLGAAAGGEEAVAAHFSRISWMLDLNREWDGGFYWNRLDGSGSGERWNDFDLSTVALLTYALPLRELHITGRGHDPARYLTTQEVAAAVAADDYDAATRTTGELVTDLGNWSPKVQILAAEEIGLRTAEHATLVPQLIAIANDTQAGESRAGACFALGEIGDGSAAADLAALLDDADDEVRYASAEALRYLPQADKLAQVDTILAAAASTGSPFFPIDEEDPMQFAHHRLCMLLFYSGNAYGPKGVIWGSGINGIDRALLYPAIEAVAGNPNGQARSTLQTTYTNLTYDDVLILSGTILDSITVRAPADKMFSGGVRTGGVEAMQMHNIADGVPACMKLIEDVPSDANLQLLGTFGGGVYTVEPDPDAVGFLESYLVSYPTGARVALDAIHEDTNPTPLNALKTVQLVTADDTTLDLPATSTVLRATAIDHAQGDSVYTWSKVFGPGAVTFTPNGTAAAATSAVQFDGTPGAYEFEVTMSDSRGLTESYGTVVVLVSDGSPPDTTAPPTPGFATPPAGTSTSSVTMTAQVVTDPEGNGVKYYFTCTSGGGNDSGWQTSPTYTDTGLLPDTTYEYTVTARDLSANQNTSAASAPAAGSTLALPTSTLSEGVFHILGSANTPTANTVHNVSVNGAYAGFQGQGNVGSTSVPVDETFNGTVVDYAFIRESATPNVIETYADGGGGLVSYGSWAARAAGNLGNSSDLKLWTATDPGAPAFSSPADFTSSTGVGTFDNINGSVDISGVTVGSVYFFYSGYRSKPLFSATMKDAEMVVADVPLPVFGDGDTANGHEHYVCSINFVNNDGCDTIDWSLTSSLYNGDPHCSLKGVVLVSSTGTTATVPDVVGLGQSGAESSITSAGFSVGTAVLRSSSTVPAGNVISQSPGSGTTALENSAVNLVVSNGPPTTAVPNVLGLEQSVAESQIVAEGLIVGSVTTEGSETVPAGDVISQSPSSGAFLVVGGAVDLVVSTGPSTTTVPDVVGLDQASAESQIETANLVVGTVTTQSHPTVPAGDVISQNPAGSTTAPVGSAVDLVVSLGMETDPPTLSGTDIVDDQSGGPVDEGTLVTYTITFSEDMDEATVDASDFSNAGTSNVTIGAIAETSPGVFTVEATPTDAGTLQLQVSAGATLTDVAGNPLDTTSAIADDTLLTVEVASTDIEILEFSEGVASGGAGDNTLVTGLDASGADKLVVVVGGEHGFPSNPSGTYFSMTYAGTPMTLAVQEDSGIPALAIFYLDNPGAAGDLVVNQENMNGTLYTVYQLKRTAPGAGPTATSTTSTVGLTTTSGGSIVIAGILNSGPDAGNNAPDMSADPPLTEDTLTDLEAGSRYTSMSTGSVVVASPATDNYSFSGAGGTDPLALAAIEFPAATPVPDTEAPTLAGGDIVDDQGGANVTVNDAVTYTLSFSEDIDESTVDASDFTNAGTAPVTIGTITETSPGVFTVVVTPTADGSLQFAVAASSVITDLADNPLDTSSAIADDTTLTVDPVPDTAAPNPDPMSFATAPAATGSSGVTMTATTATDPSGVEYYFACTAGGGNDSGWQDSPVYEDTGLLSDTEYTYTVTARDKSPARNTTAPSAPASATTDSGSTPVSDFAGADIVVAGTVSGTAADTQASDNVRQAITEIESGGKPSNRHSYLEHKWSFNVTGGTSVTFSVEAHHTANSEGDDFIFAYSTTGVDGAYTDMVTVTKTSDDDTPQTFVLPPGVSGVVHVRVVDTDQSQGNGVLDTIFIDEMRFESVSGPPDTESPAPDPMSFAVAPAAAGSSSITMTATTASDPSGVEYYFTCTAGGGNDSGWQDSAAYADTGLTPETQYSYTVTARDKSANQNATAPSPAASATTDAATNATDHAEADIVVSGSVAGSFTDTHASDDGRQAITEIESGGKPSNRHSHLEHKWSFTVSGGATVTFSVEAHHTGNSEGDDFTFAYSTTGVDGAYTDMVTVTKTSDDDTPQTFVLPGGVSGVVHVRVVDTDQSQGNKVLDTIFIDEMAFLSEVGPAPLLVNDESMWSVGFGEADLSDPSADFDGDGLTNHEEYIWGLDPTDAGSARPMAISASGDAIQLHYSRRDPALSGISYAVWYSTDLRDWILDPEAVQVPGATGGDGVQSVEVTLGSAPAGLPRAFLQVRASD